VTERVQRLLARADRGTAFAAAAAILAGVALLDHTLPPDVDLGEFYMVAVIVGAWAIGWRTGLAFAVAGASLELAADLLFRLPTPAPPAGTVLWNGLSDVGVLAAIAVITDRLYRARRRWIDVDAEQRSLLRVLDRELPRPLRAIGWFARTFEEAVDRESIDAVKAQFGPLRHHIRDANFLVMDLLAVGHLQSAGIHFERRPVSLNALVTAAADETLYRTRVFPRLSADDPFVLADADRIRHAVASIIGRYLELSPYEPVTVLTRASGDEAVVEIGSAAGSLEPADVELTDLLVRGHGGRMYVVARGPERGSLVSLYLPRAGTEIERAASRSGTGGHEATVQEG
jgi:signal transduction histidine kinase